MLLKNIISILCLLAFIYTLGVSCSTEDIKTIDNKSINQKPLNPNGDSELALLMRAMFDEMAIVKNQIAKGEDIKITIDHEKILTAHATEPHKAASDEYKAFSKTYLKAVEILKNSSGEKLPLAFNHLVDNCMNCHKALCPGPIVRIQKLQ